MPNDRPTLAKPNIVIVDASIAVTGGLKCAARMAQLLEPWARFTLVLPASSCVPEKELSAFDDVKRMPIMSLRRSVGAILSYVPALIAAGWSLRRLLRDKQARALVINDFYLAHGWVARRLGYRGSIVTWVRFDPQRFPAVLSNAWLAAARLASDRVITVSEFMRGRIPWSLHAEVIYDSVAPDLPVGRANYAPRHRVVFVGNYIRGKGQQDAIEAFRLIADRFPDIQLIFRGGDMGLAKNRDYRSSRQHSHEWANHSQGR